jgi:hypothetical protein
MSGFVGDGKSDALAFTGRFWARLWDFDCVLDLRVNSAGTITGSFIADGEALEVVGEAPDLSGTVRGVIRARNLTDLFARFDAQQDAEGAFLTLVMNGSDTSWERTERVRFERLF